MSVSLKEAIKTNEDAIKALEAAIERLEELRKGRPLSRQKPFTREISRARAEIKELKIVDAHLNAAATVIKPMDAAVEKRLEKLAERLDEAIKKDALLTATLETVVDVIDKAVAVKDIINEHS